MELIHPSEERIEIHELLFGQHWKVRATGRGSGAHYFP
jgi:hypothetical protein